MRLSPTPRSSGFKPLFDRDREAHFECDGMKRMLAKLSEAGTEAVVTDQIAAEPVDTTFSDGVKRFRAEGRSCDKGPIGFWRWGAPSTRQRA